MTKTVKVEVTDANWETRIDTYEEVTGIEVAERLVIILWEGGSTILPIGSFERIDIEDNFEGDEE